jgi:hypothetical protein
MHWTPITQKDSGLVEFVDIEIGSIARDGIEDLSVRSRMPMTVAKVISAEDIAKALTRLLVVPAGGICPLVALDEFGGGPTDRIHEICGFALRHTLASHGCCSRGKPDGR